MQSTKISKTGFVLGSLKDRFDFFNADLQAWVLEHPLAPMADIEGFYDTIPVLRRTIFRGDLRIADTISQHPNGQPRQQADPCFCGAYDTDKIAQSAIKTLAAWTAGSSFYLAQAIYRYTQQYDKSTFKKLKNKEITHFDALYWRDQYGWKRRPDMKKVNQATQKRLKAFASYYWDIATKIIRLEESIADTRCPDAAKPTYQEAIGNEYLHLAMQEKELPLAFHWLLQKARKHYAQAGAELALSILDSYIDLTSGNDDEILERVTTQFKQQTPEDKEQLLRRFDSLAESTLTDDKSLDAPDQATHSRSTDSLTNACETDEEEKGQEDQASTGIRHRHFTSSSKSHFYATKQGEPTPPHSQASNSGEQLKKSS